MTCYDAGIQIVDAKIYKTYIWILFFFQANFVILENYFALYYVIIV